MHMSVHHLLAHYGYFGVFMILLTEMIGIPFPAETTLTVSGFEWMKGTFSLIPLLISAALGNILGSTIAYSIGYYLGRPVIIRFGKYVGITEERLNVAERKFSKYRTIVVLFSKFIAGIRVLVPYLAGINRMPFFLFSAYNAISAFAWAAFFIIIGRYIEVGWARYHHALRHHYALIIAIVVLVACIIIVKKVFRKSKSQS